MYRLSPIFDFDQGKAARFSGRLGYLLLRHDLQNDTVILPHTLRGQHAHIVDGVLHIRTHDAVAGTEVVAGTVHVIAQNTALHAHGDLAGTAGLGAVADAAGDHGHCVLQRVGDAVIVRAPQPRDTAAGAHTGGWGSPSSGA